MQLMRRHVFTESLLRDIIENKNAPEEILRIFARAAFSTEVLVKLNPFEAKGHPYSREVIHSSPECEVMIARWRPQIACAPHNHGASTGWTFYLQGSFKEVSYAWNSDELLKLDHSTFTAGSYSRVHAGDLHSCESETGGVSLHIYFPRIERMSVYDLKGRRTFVVTDDCGAWVPDDHQRLEERSWKRNPSTTAAS